MDEFKLEQPITEPDELAENSEGSIFGKFKDAKTLLEAYTNLEAEFTRKSQKLAELQKENDKIALLETSDNIENVLKNQDDKDRYKKEITELIENDNELNKLPNKNQLAYKVIKLAESKTADTLNDQNFVDKFINDNTAVKNKIITEYLSTLNNLSNIPKIISGNSSNIHFSPNTDEPKTIREAGEIFSKMLK